MGIRRGETVSDYLDRMRAEQDETRVVERLRKRVPHYSKLLTIDESEIKDYEKTAKTKPPSWVWLPDIDKQKQPGKNIWGGPFGQYTWPNVSVRLSPGKEFGNRAFKSGGFVGDPKFVGWAKFLWSQAHTAKQVQKNTRVYWEHYTVDLHTNKFYLAVYQTRMVDFTINLANMGNGWSHIKLEITRAIAQSR